ncbi:hypothetical protein JYT83_01510 [bacterium AH-315-F18]|nr:hypothetical protein [bacterium AH-315-F18]
MAILRFARSASSFFFCSFLALFVALSFQQDVWSDKSGGEILIDLGQELALEELVPEGHTALRGHITSTSGQIAMASVLSMAGTCWIEGANGESPERILLVDGGYIPAEVKNGYKVRTGADGAIKLKFIDAGTGGSTPDRSTLTIHADSEVLLDRTLLSPKRSQLEARSTGRRIKIIVGWIDSFIDPNEKSIQTDFETPFGVAAVKGTRPSISVQRNGSVSITLKSGALFLEGSFSGGTLGKTVVNLSAGQDLTMLADNDQALFSVSDRSKGQIQIISNYLDTILTAGNDLALIATGNGEAMLISNTGKYTVKLPNGKTIDVNPGDAITIKLSPKTKTYVVSKDADIKKIWKRKIKQADENREASPRRK